jgi:hypothetical protein
LSEWYITLSNAKLKNKKTGALIPITRKSVRASLNHRREKKTASPIGHPLATVRSNVRFRTPTEQNFANKQRWTNKYDLKNTEDVTVGR